MARLRGVGPLVNLALFVLLVGGALWFMRWLKAPIGAEAVATLVGALIGGAAILLGNAISGLDERAQRAEQLESRRAILKTLITAELVSIATDLLSAKPLLDAALDHARTVGPIGGLGLRDDFPRQAALTMGLGAELLILEKPDIDALVTLQENLAVTRATLKDSADPQGRIGLLQVTALVEGFAFDMEILAQCFERIAPTRQFKFGTDKPELVSTVLKDTARSHHELLAPRPRN